MVMVWTCLWAGPLLESSRRRCVLNWLNGRLMLNFRRLLFDGRRCRRQSFDRGLLRLVAKAQLFSQFLPAVGSPISIRFAIHEVNLSVQTC